MATKKQPTKPTARPKTATKAKVSAVKAKSAKAAIVGASQLKGHGSGFIEFIRTQGVIGLAIGLAIGAAAGDTVKKLVEAFISPIVQLIVGSKTSLEAATWTLEIGSRVGEFKWGGFRQLADQPPRHGICNLYGHPPSQTRPPRQEKELSRPLENEKARPSRSWGG